MKEIFAKISNPELRHQAESRIGILEQEYGIRFSEDYRSFLLELETYIDDRRTHYESGDYEALVEEIDDLFAGYSFILPNVDGEFEITDLANISLGYSLLDELQDEKDEVYTEYFSVGNIWHSGDMHYFLALNEKGEVYLLLNHATNEELDLSDYIVKDPTLVSASWKFFLELLNR